MSHHCHATDCKVPVPPVMFMCKRHWFSLPEPMRNRVKATYRPGQCDDWNISHEYANAAREAVRYVASIEGREPNTRVYDMLDPGEPKLDIYEFGRRLLRTNDLDPVYVVVYEAKKRGDLEGYSLDRWLMAYWCFYHVGTACWCTEGDTGYWDRMMKAAGSKDYPRSSERRHFRADNAISSVVYLRDRGLMDLFRDIYGAGETAEEVMAAVQKWIGFGPWIAFKVADMIERVGLRPVKFQTSTVLYDSPRKAAELLLKHEGNEGDRPDDVGAWAIDRVLSKLKKELNPETKIKGAEKLSPNDWKHVDQFRKFLAGYAPPSYDRPIGPQEAETILCKWGSYMNGQYHIGEDLAATRRGLLRFAGCRLSQKLLKAGKAGGLW